MRHLFRIPLSARRRSRRGMQRRYAMQVSLTRLHVFYLTALYGSMKKAAEKLYVSPPAVTMHIRNLEEELGLPLFARKQGGLLLTEQGKKLYDLVEPMFRQLDGIERYLDDLVSGEHRELRFGTHHLNANFFIPDLLAHVRTLHPELSMQMTLGVQDVLLEKLAAHQLDLVLIIGEPPQDARFQAVPLFNVEMVPVTAHHALFASATASMQEMDGVPLLLQQRGGGARKTVMDWFERFGVRPDILLDDLSSDVIKQFLPRYRALSFIACFIVQQELDSGLFRRITLREGFPILRFHIVHNAAPVSRPVRQFLESIRSFSPSFRTAS